MTEVIRPDEEPVLKKGDGTDRLWVRVPRLPLLDDTTRVPGVIGSTAGSNPVGQGSNPWGRALVLSLVRGHWSFAEKANQRGRNGSIQLTTDN